VIRKAPDGSLPAVLTDHQEALWLAFLDCYSATATREALTVFLAAIAALGGPR
jgi:hypothetical protein